MAGMNWDDDMSSNSRNVGFRLLYGEGDLIDQGILIRGWSRRGGGKKLYVDSNRAVLQGIAGLPG